MYMKMKVMFLGSHALVQKSQSLHMLMPCVHDLGVKLRIKVCWKGALVPKTLTDQRLPDDVAYNFQKLVKQFIKDNGL